MGHGLETISPRLRFTWEFRGTIILGVPIAATIGEPSDPLTKGNRIGKRSSLFSMEVYFEPLRMLGL